MDIYFDPNYGKLYERIENGTCEVFKYTSSLGTIQHMFIKRVIPVPINNKVYCDLVTPYGYGGPVILHCREGHRNQLVNEFKQCFQQYCAQNGVVSEFVRFHPVFGNAEDFRDCYSIEYVRNTVGTSLDGIDDPFQSVFSKSCRHRVRRALRDGVGYRVAENPTSLDMFRIIYYSTMNRNNASGFYYFDDEYFDQCLRFFQDKLVLVEAVYETQTIAAALCFRYGRNIHIHLSGTLTEYLHLSPAYVLRYAIIMWASENGYSLIHHGGGRTNRLDDGLYCFKKQFGNIDFRFFVGKKIWNEDCYWRLCENLKVDKTSDFFPAYRALPTQKN